MVGDYPNNLKLLLPSNVLEKTKRKNLNILDLCCGPGIAGIHIHNELERLGFGVDKVTFVDINKSRLKAIPNNPKYSVHMHDVLEYREDHNFDIATLRCAIYYFNTQNQYKLLRNLHGLLNHQGILIITSLGRDDSQAGFFTNLHRTILDMKQIKYDGYYMSPETLKTKLTNVGIKPFDTLTFGNTRWNSNSLGDKYGLSKNQKVTLAEWLCAQSKSDELACLNFKITPKHVDFDMPLFNLFGTKTES